MFNRLAVRRLYSLCVLAAAPFLASGCGGGGSSGGLFQVPGQVNFPAGTPSGPLVQGKVLGSPLRYVKAPRAALVSLAQGSPVTVASAPVGDSATYQIRLPALPPATVMVEASTASLPAGYSAPLGAHLAILQVDLIDDGNSDGSEATSEFLTQNYQWFVLYASSPIQAPDGQPPIPGGWSLVKQSKDTPEQVTTSLDGVSVDLDLRQLDPYNSTRRLPSARRLFWQ